MTMKSVLALLAVLAWLVSPAASADPMRVVYFDSYFPFSWKDDSGRMRGILVDVLNEALERRAGLELEHTGYPWKRAQALVRSGRADAFVTGATPERREYTQISIEPVIVTQDVLFTWAGHPKMEVLKAVRRIEDLKPFKVVTYIGNGWAEENLKDINVRWVATQDNVLTMLDRRRDDVTIESSLINHALLKRLGLSHRIVEVPGPIIAEYAYSLCIAKHSPFTKVLPTFDAVMRDMRTDGTLERILQDYR